MAARTGARALRRAPLVAGMAVLSLVLAACTSQEEDPDASPAPESSSPTTSPTAEPQRLQVAVYGDRTQVQAYRTIADAYEADNPGTKVRVRVRADASRAAEAAAENLRSGTGPDIFLLDQEDLPVMVETGGLQPVDSLLESAGLEFGDDYQRVALTSFSAEDRLQCMPAEMSPLVVYYNKRLIPRRLLAVQDVSLPTRKRTSWSFEDFETTARVTAGRDRFGPITGVFIPSDLETLTAFKRSAGADIVDDVFAPTTLVLTDDEGIEAISELARVIGDSAVSPGTGADVDAVELFLQGQLGMFVGTRAELPRLRAAEDLSFDVFPLPSLGRTQSVSYINGFCVNAATESEELAADFIAFAVGVEGAKIAASSGAIVPSNLDVVYGRPFLQPGAQPRSAYVYGAAVRRSEPLPYSAAWDEVATAAEVVLRPLYRVPSLTEEVLERRLTRLEERSEAIFGSGAEERLTE